MTLLEVQETQGVPVAHLRAALGLPDDTDPEETLGRLRQAHGFGMSDVRAVVAAYADRVTPPSPADPATSSPADPATTPLPDLSLDAPLGEPAQTADGAMSPSTGAEGEPGDGHTGCGGEGEHEGSAAPELNPGSEQS